MISSWMPAVLAQVCIHSTSNASSKQQMLSATDPDRSCATGAQGFTYSRQK